MIFPFFSKPVLGNLDPYSGKIRTCLCTQYAEYRRQKVFQKTHPIFFFFAIMISKP